MNRDRDAFFSDTPQSLFGRESPFFRQSRPGSGFEDFPIPPARTTSTSPANLMGFPEKMESSRKSSAPTAAPSSDSNSNQAESIPIRVIHEKHKYAPGGGHSRTADLPTGPNPGATSQRPPEQHGSPRVTRAHSEPPKTFNQRILKTKIPLGNVSEQNENNLSTSASEPSVPRNESPNRGDTISGTPRPAASGAPRPTSASAGPNTEPTVRHIPIMVEGREEPLNVGAGAGAAGSGKKPSDFYPPNVKVDRRTREQVPPATLKVNNLKNVQNQEPTSPLSPIPSDQPIPMGYQQEPIDEASAPQAPTKIQNGENQTDKKPEPVSATPIPMPCSEEYLKPNQDKPSQPEQEASAASAASNDSATLSEAAKLKRQEDPCFSKLDKIMENVHDLEKQLKAFQSDKNSKEYKFLDEMLTRNLLALDGIETAGRDDVRQQRKESIKSINRCLSILESKANSNQAEKNNAILSDLAQQSSNK